MLHETIYDVLKTIEADTYPGMVEQRTQLPFINHFEVSRNALAVQNGAASINLIRYQVSIFAATKASALTIAASVLSALDRKPTGNILAINFESQEYDYEVEIPAHHVWQEYLIKEKV
jgi:hypothetical protein